MSVRPQFSIKDVLWLTALIGIGVGWYMDHHAAAVRQESDRAALSRIDTFLQIQAQALRFFQQDLNELKRQP